jgi:hypothetical protein
VQLGLTVAILVLVRYQLQGLSTVAVDGKLAFAETCYLSLPDDWPGACVFGMFGACQQLLHIGQAAPHAVWNRAAAVMALPLRSYASSCTHTGVACHNMTHA